MQTYAVIEEHYTYNKVTYYSLRIGDEEWTETEKFYQRFMNDEIHKEEFDDLLNWIEYIGEKEGAIPQLFRHEADAQALPPERRAMEYRNMLFEIGYNLRLYCLRINKEIVILLNGGIKESQKVQNSPDLLQKFRLANVISKKVTEKIMTRDIWVDGKELKGDLEISF